LQRKNKEFARNVVIVSLGPIIISILGFFLEPWIARLWSPEIIGIGAYFNSLLQILTPAMFLRYNFAIVQAETDEEAHNLFFLSLIIFFIFMLAIIIFYNDLGRLFPENQILIKYRFFVITALFMGALCVLLRFWCSSQKQFRFLSFSAILFQVSYTGLLLVFGVNDKTSADDIIHIQAIAYYIYPLVPLVFYLRKSFSKAIKSISWKGILDVAKKYKQYPLNEYLGFLASIVAFNIPVLLIAKYWGKEITGLYSKSFFILYMFVTLVGDSINRVLHKEIADMINAQEEIRGFIDKILNLTISISIIPFVIVCVLGPELFGLFLGERWTLSGVFAQSLSIWCFANLINLAFLPLYGVLNRQKEYTRFTVTSLFLRVLILSYFGRRQMNIVLAMLIFSLVNFIILMWQSLHIISIAGANAVGTLKFIGNKLLQLSPWIITMLLIKHFSNFSSFLIVIISIITISPYFIYILHKNKESIKSFFSREVKYNTVDGY